MGYLFLAGCIILVVVISRRSLRQSASHDSSQSSTSKNINIDVQQWKPLIFWTTVPPIIIVTVGVVFFFCIVGPIKSCTNYLASCTNYLAKESDKATAEMQRRDRESRLMYLDYQRRAAGCCGSRSSRHRHTRNATRRSSSRDPFYESIPDPPLTD